MRTVVYKYRVRVEDEFDVPLPVGSEVLSVQMQHGEPVMWVRHTSDTTKIESRRFRLAGTGHLIVGEWLHIGTFQMSGGDLVFHLFEEIRQ